MRNNERMKTQRNFSRPARYPAGTPPAARYCRAGAVINEPMNNSKWEVWSDPIENAKTVLPKFLVLTTDRQEFVAECLDQQDAKLIAAAPTMLEALTQIANAETRGVIQGAPGQLQAVVKIAQRAISELSGNPGELAAAIAQAEGTETARQYAVANAKLAEKDRVADLEAALKRMVDSAAAWSPTMPNPMKTTETKYTVAALLDFDPCVQAVMFMIMK
jgi:hypothetical protein